MIWWIKIYIARPCRWSRIWGELVWADLDLGRVSFGVSWLETEKQGRREGNKKREGRGEGMWSPPLIFQNVVAPLHANSEPSNYFFHFFANNKCLMFACVCIVATMERHRQQQHQHQQVRPPTRLLVDSVSDLTGELQFRVDHGRLPWGVQAADNGRRAAMAVVMRRLPGGPRVPAGRRARAILTAAVATSYSDDLTYGDVC